MAGLSAVMKTRILEVLDATSFRQSGFGVMYGDEKDASATIRFSARPEYRFVIGLTENGFITSECPGVKSDRMEVFQRGDYELCLQAIRAWAARIVDSEADDILDEFGGVADRNPYLPSS